MPVGNRKRREGLRAMKQWGWFVLMMTLVGFEPRGRSRSIALRVSDPGWVREDRGDACTVR
jgi:hypothetical protein